MKGGREYPGADSEVCLCVCAEDMHLYTRVCARVKAEGRRGVGGGLSFYSWEAKIQPKKKNRRKSERREGCTRGVRAGGVDAGWRWWRRWRRCGALKAYLI